MSAHNILLDTSPLHSGHAVRGVGMYTRQLLAALQQLPDIHVATTAEEFVGTRPDVIHYPFFDLFFASLPIWLTAPTVVTIHDVIPLLFPKAYPKGMRGWARFLRQRCALRGVSAVITDSLASQQDIHTHLGVPLQKITVIPLAAAAAFVPVSEHAQQVVRHKYALKERYLLYVGDINYNKNLPQLIKALKFLPDDLHVVMVGKHMLPQAIPEWRAIETQIALSDVADRVHFLPSVPPEATEDMSALYAAAEVYVQPSLYEGFGLPVLEALQVGVPVVSARTSSLVEVGGTHVTFAEPVAEDLARAVQTVLEWPADLREETIVRGRAWASSFSWLKVARATRQVYDSVGRGQ